MPCASTLPAFAVKPRFSLSSSVSLVSWTIPACVLDARGTFRTFSYSTSPSAILFALDADIFASSAFCTAMFALVLADCSAVDKF